MHVTHLTSEQLENGLDEIRRSPVDQGVLQLIVRRPRVDEREVVDEGRLSLADGLVGDSWKTRGSRRSADGSPDPETQLTLMNARVASLVAGSKDRWPLAGDQLFVDIDLSRANLPPGSRLTIGSAVVEVSEPPHTGCGKFVSRYGVDAMKFVNSARGRDLSLRGINARVTRPGLIRVGDAVTKVADGAPGGPDAE